MTDVIEWIVGRFSKFFIVLNNLMIVDKVSVLTFMVAVFILGVLINQLVRRAG